MIPMMIIGMWRNADIKAVVRDPSWASGALDLDLNEGWHVYTYRIQGSLIRLLRRVLESLIHCPTDLIVLPYR